jgi:hypothetical protein
MTYGRPCRVQRKSSHKYVALPNGTSAYSQVTRDHSGPFDSFDGLIIIISRKDSRIKYQHNRIL